MRSIGGKQVLGGGVLMLAMTAGMMVLPISAQEAAKKGPAKGRLPPYYGDVVDEAERQKIYEIQAQYDTKIDKLEAELEAIKAERDGKIEKSLPPAKLKKIEELKAAAAAKREDKTKKPEEKKLDIIKPGVKLDPKK